MIRGNVRILFDRLRSKFDGFCDETAYFDIQAVGHPLSDLGRMDLPVLLPVHHCVASISA
jgi:hypothetical protein